VTPGLVNTHHHIYQNLTRAYPPMTDKPLFGWLQSLYPLWRAIDEEAVYASAFVGLAELALSGCTTSTDHLYLHPRGAGDLLSAEIAAARELGMRFHPTRGSMSLSEKDGGLPPDDVVADDDEILAASEAAVHPHHDRSHGAMVRIALAPCSPFSVTEQLMVPAPSWPSGSTCACTRTSRRTPRTTSSRWPPSAAGRWSTSSAPAGAATAPGWRTA
jgi:cytosine/adenosine deaminase-related metal-dependent hydrolase